MDLGGAVTSAGICSGGNELFHVFDGQFVRRARTADYTRDDAHLATQPLLATGLCQGSIGGTCKCDNHLHDVVCADFEFHYPKKLSPRKGVVGHVSASNRFYGSQHVGFAVLRLLKMGEDRVRDCDGNTDEGSVGFYLRVPDSAC